MDFVAIRLFTQQVIYNVYWASSSSSTCPTKSGLSILLSLSLSLSLSRCFLAIGSLAFSKFWHGARNPNEVVHDRTRFFQKNFFCLKHWENGSILVFNFHGICSITKTYICCCSVYNLYLVEILFVGYGPKCSLPVRLQYL